MGRVAVIIGAGAVIDATAELGFGRRLNDGCFGGVDTPYVTDNIVNPRYAGDWIRNDNSQILKSMLYDLGRYCDNPNFEDLYEYLIKARNHLSGFETDDSG